MANKIVSLKLKHAQSRLLNMNSKKILNSVPLLYIVLFASISDLLYMVSVGSQFNVIVFILIAFITSLFSKNMMIILIVALALTNIYDLGKKIVLKEGFEENDTNDKIDNNVDEDKENKEDKEDKENKEDIEDKEETDKSSKSNNQELPDEFKKALEQMSNPETRKTIEGLKELEPMVDKIQKILKMFK